MEKMTAKIIELDGQEVFCITSLQIAEQTGKDHKNVMRDIKVMLQGLEIDTLKFELIYSDSMNRSQDMFVLPEREAMSLSDSIYR